MKYPNWENTGIMKIISFLLKHSFSYSIDITGFHSFSFFELKDVTNNFDERPISVGGNKMGEGGFGVVYKGYVNNRTVAVKKLAAVSYIFWKRKNYRKSCFLVCCMWVSESCSVVSNSLRPHGLYSSWNSPDQNTGVGSLSLLQEIFPTQESNQGFLHCRRILYELSYEGIINIKLIFRKHYFIVYFLSKHHSKLAVLNI